MAFELVAWNLQEGLAQPATAVGITERIKQLNADVLVLSDAFSLTNTKHVSDGEILQTALGRLEAAGYENAQTEYDDEERWSHDRNIIVLNRLGVGVASQVRLASRNAIALATNDPDSLESVQIIGAHFDDRGETIRLRQAKACTDLARSGGPFAIAGDLNNMHRRDMMAGGARLTGMLGLNRLLPGERPRSVAGRVIEMAEGLALSHLEKHDFRDADSDHSATFPSRAPALQPDHIMVSRQVQAEDFRVYPHFDGTDHRAIGARLAIAAAGSD